jgi:predicted kinase
MLIIVRGLPGSGKSTYGKKLGCYHVESDMYFVINGEYVFDHRRLSAAHIFCAKAVRKALEHGMDVCVSNTFTQYWEVAPYITMADEMKVPYKIVELQTQFGNIHGVPEEKFIAMTARWEDFTTFGESVEIITS